MKTKKRYSAAIIMRKLAGLLLLLIIPVLSFGQTPLTANREQLESAKKAFEAIAQNNSFTESLASASQTVLPVGIMRVVNNMKVTVAVDKVIFHSDYNELSVYAQAILPQKSKNDDASGKESTLFFGARSIKLSHDGSIIGDANLTLLQDVEIPFNGSKMSVILKGDYENKTGNTQSKTYMSIDCGGFKEFGLDAEVCFPTTLIENADEKTASADPVVRGHFTTVVSGWNDIIANITLPTFRIVGLDGFLFNLQNVVFDFSDIRNDETVRYPADYQQKYTIPGAPTLWQGVYAEAVEVTLPKAFNNNTDQPTRFLANGLLIDDNGITGLFTAENLLAFESGSASGWNFSVSTFRLELEANKLLAAGFKGEIGLPFKGEKTRLNYAAVIQENNEYLMQVSTIDSLDFSIFNAKATILPNSYLKLHVVNNRFKPEALLHGNMSIAAGGDTPTSIPDLEFRSLLLKTESPYISVEYLGYNGRVSFGSFPVSLSNIALKANDRDVELASNIEINLSSGMFAGKTRLAFLASLHEEGNRRHWQFDGVRLDDIAVDAKIAEAVTLKGTVSWRRDDPVYGEGFYGDLKVGIIKPFNLEVGMKAGFGKKDDFRYWFAEGETVLPQGIPVAGLMSLKGFSGAVSNQMIGRGNQYIPDRDTGLGIKAAVLFTVGAVANGRACFDMAFSRKGGLNFIGFYGYAEFPGGKLKTSGLREDYTAILEREDAHSGSELEMLKQMDQNKAAEIVFPLPSSLKHGIMGSVGIQYDFRNRAFHAQAELIVDVLGGFIRGTGKGHKAGWGVMHFDPSEWYVHLGAPDNRLGVKISLGHILNISSGTYLMTGSRIPAMPPPPSEVAEILHQDLSRLALGRNMDALGLAKGFAFGTDFRVATGDITFLMLYANFMAGLGFDIMLKDYGEAECRGRSGAVGMNGWFAQGQAYAYLQGELGVKIHLWFLKTKFPIIKGGAAALMQAMFPNPGYFKGYLGVNVNVLGLIKGHMRFKLSIGEECDLVIPGSSPIEMVMINDVSPSDGEDNVSVFTMPQATFNTTIGQPFEAEDDEGIATYRIQLKSFTVTDDKGNTVRGELKWNSNKDAVMFQAKEILPPGVPLKAEVQVSFDRLENGQWKTVYTSGQESVEKRECTFTTGGAPENIPMENILYTYPVVDQRYYLPEEYREGYVQLQFGQKYLFEKGFDYRLMFTGQDKQAVQAPFRYNEGANRLEFSMPELKKQEKYTLRIAYTADENSVSSTGTAASKQLMDSEDGSLTMSGKTAVSGVNTGAEKDILNYAFTTSKYRTFRQKMNAIKTKDGAVAEDAGISMRFLYKVQADEAFDEAEVTGVDKSEGKALIQPYAELKEPFFTNVVHPMVYEGYPIGGMHLQNREESEVGVPPVKSVFVYSPYLDLISENKYPTKFFFPYSYETSIIWELDFRDLQSQVVNNRSRVDNDTYMRFLNGRLPFIKKGKYKTVLKYVLPGGKETTAYGFEFNNFLKLNE